MSAITESLGYKADKLPAFAIAFFGLKTAKHIAIAPKALPPGAGKA
jgi:hypothetical protein